VVGRPIEMGSQMKRRPSVGAEGMAKAGLRRQQAHHPLCIAHRRRLENVRLNARGQERLDHRWLALVDRRQEWAAAIDHRLMGQAGMNLEQPHRLAGLAAGNGMHQIVEGDHSLNPACAGMASFVSAARRRPGWCNR
jgi:hypothetical protein